jgi:hypothetical protein
MFYGVLVVGIAGCSGGGDPGDRRLELWRCYVPAVPLIAKKNAA